MSTLLTTVPFSGFYESLHDHLLDTEYESIWGDEEFLHFDNVRWSEVRPRYAKYYAEQWACNEGIILTFNKLVSPREYNFTTDVIVCNISIAEAMRVFLQVDREILDTLIDEKFSSYPGFYSFYPNRLSEWPTDIGEWDQNQVGTLLEAYFTGQFGGNLDYYNETDVMESAPVGEWLLDASGESCES